MKIALEQSVAQLFSTDSNERQAAKSALQAAGISPEQALQAVGLNDFGIYQPSDFSPRRSEISVYGRYLPSLAPLLLLPALRSLSIHKCRVGDWSHLPKVQGLTSLDLCATPIDTDVLRALRGVQRFDFDFQEVSSLGFLVEWQALESLSIMGLPLRSLESLPLLPTLREICCLASDLPYDVLLAFQKEHPTIHLQHSYPDGDVAALLCSGIPENIELVKRHWDLDKQQAFIAEKGWTRFGLQQADDFKQVGTLEVSPHTCSDLQPLRSFWALEALRADQNAISDLSALTGMHRLQRLSLRFNAIRDIRPLEALFQLKAVALSGNEPLEDVSPLRAMQSLESLLLDGTGVRDLSPLSALSQLSWLNIAYCPVSDLSPLYALPALRDLDCTGTFVTEAALADFRAHCPHCSVSI